MAGHLVREEYAFDKQVITDWRNVDGAASAADIVARREQAAIDAEVMLFLQAGGFTTHRNSNISLIDALAAEGPWSENDLYARAGADMAKAFVEQWG